MLCYCSEIATCKGIQYNYLRPAVYRRSVRLGDNPLRPTTRIFIFQLNTCSYSPYVTSSLTRGWVCSIQFLLALASAVILRSDSRGTRDHTLLSQIRDSCSQVPVFISPRKTLKTPRPTFVLLLYMYLLPRERVNRAVA
jgi:hypothetical protein